MRSRTRGTQWPCPPSDGSAQPDGDAIGRSSRSPAGTLHPPARVGRVAPSERNRPMTSGTTVIGYLRCSTSDQAESGAGLDAQRAAIEDHCQKRGWQVLNWAEDHASGKSLGGRPALAEAIAQ